MYISCYTSSGKAFISHLYHPEQGLGIRLKCRQRKLVSRIIFHLACMHGLMLSSTISPMQLQQSHDHHIFDAVTAAFKEGGTDRVDTMLSNRHLDINCCDEKGKSALMVASTLGDVGIVGLLLKKGAQVDLQDDRGETALMYASKEGHCEVVNMLLENGAQVDLLSNGGVHCGSALIFASGTCVVKLLLENGAQIDLQSNFDMSLCMNACANNDLIDYNS